VDQLWSQIVDFFTGPGLQHALSGAVVLIVGLLLARWGSRLTGRLAARRGSAQYSLIMRRLTYYVVLGVTLVVALAEFGLELSILLGAAGILTVAFGFASQTSASNLISGLFLLGEQPFVVGDVIRVGQTTGSVLSIDALSVKLRTFDNLLVRIPNETLLKSEITNVSHFPIRRLDIALRLPYHEDVDRVRSLVIQLAQRHPLCLDEPRPQVFFQGFGESALDLQLSVWAARETWFELKNALQEQVKTALTEHAIEPAFPHRTLYAGSPTRPLTVRVVTRGEADPPDENREREDEARTRGRS
jgi:small-conductance mechanosensitive channel